MVAITSWVVDDWPFSWAKFLDFYTIIFNSDGTNIDVYEAYCGTDDAWVATKIIENLTVKPSVTVYPINIDFADFGWFYAMSYAEMSSGSLNVIGYYRDPDIASGTDAVTALPISSCPEFISCCNFNGQMIGGGIVSTDSRWTQLGRCSVAWGAIGQFEFRPDSNKTAGYRKMPWSDWDEGIVCKVAPLGKGVMVYGNGGRAGLIPFTNEMTTGFGLKEMAGPGIVKGFHFAGDKNLHGILDTNNEFWIGTPDMQFNKLGYKEWFDDLLAENLSEAAGTPLMISYDHYKKRFYFGGFSSGYVLTEFGLYKCHQSTTSIGRYRGTTLTGFVKDHTDYEGRLAVDNMDFKVRGLKTIDTLEYGSKYTPSGSYVPSGAIDFSYTHSDTFRNSTWIRLNNEGNIFPLITANDFRIKYKVDDYRDGDPTLDYINVRFKVVDKRAIRGPYNVN